jgi:excisionase family DNA binding protein
MPPQAEPKEFAFSVQDFARRIGLSRSLLYEEIAARRLPSVKIRGRRLILAEDGADWLRAHRDAAL